MSRYNTITGAGSRKPKKTERQLYCMYFLEKIDLIYKNECEQNQIPNDAEDYSVFIPLDITDQSYSYHFLIMKGEKAKLQIVSGKQRVYLSDSQIIQTILNMSKADIDWFLSQFVLLYQGQGTPICFKIEQESFLGSGIKPYPSKKPLLLMSDTAIDYPCFCLLLNYILVIGFNQQNTRYRLMCLLWDIGHGILGA